MGEGQKASLTKSSESFFDQKPKNIKEMAETEVRMENIVLALLAHVDRGKTSLSEALLYESGRISEKGRVDHGDSVLDKDSLERKKGITIYAKSVYFTKENKRFFLLDTPGHQEFSSEMERCLAVMDYGILLIDGNDGIQKRELHLFERAREKGIPLFLVVKHTRASYLLTILFIFFNSMRKVPSSLVLISINSRFCIYSTGNEISMPVSVLIL